MDFNIYDDFKIQEIRYYRKLPSNTLFNLGKFCKYSQYFNPLFKFKLMNKVEIHAKCFDLIDLKLNELQKEISELNSSVQNETKSSAGDKHETSRAMIQQEIDFANQRLKELQIAKSDLNKINPLLVNKSINTGSLIETNIGNIYFALALGKIKYQNLDFNVLSIQSPIGLLLKEKNKGDKIILNGKEVIIHSIY